MFTAVLPHAARPHQRPLRETTGLSAVGARVQVCVTPPALLPVAVSCIGSGRWFLARKHLLPTALLSVTVTVTVSVSVSRRPPRPPDGSCLRRNNNSTIIIIIFFAGRRRPSVTVPVGGCARARHRRATTTPRPPDDANVGGFSEASGTAAAAVHAPRKRRHSSGSADDGRACRLGEAVCGTGTGTAAEGASCRGSGPDVHPLALQEGDLAFDLRDAFCAGLDLLLEPASEEKTAFRLGWLV